ncbi:MAG: DUF739 family protein [Tissierellia bacterium]|nr:DUF739 family protein [Tissierellia bacterium]
MRTYNYNKLKGLIREHYGTYENFCKNVGLGTTTLYTRLNNQTYFDQIEMEKIIKSFKIDDYDKIMEIFFTFNNGNPKDMTNDQ